MLSKKKCHLLFISLLIVLLSLSLFVINTHAQFPYGPPVGGGYYPGISGNPYALPIGGGYPYGGGGYQPYPYYQQPYPYYQQPYPYYQQPYPYYQQQYPYYQQQYPYYQQPYPYYQQQYPYYQQQYPYYQQQYPYYQQQYPYYQQPTYQQADLMLDSTDNGDDFTVDKGETISIILSSNSSTGYMWMLDADDPDTDIVSKTSSQYFPGYTGMVGAGGTEQWIFEAEDEGTTTILMYYRRSWETTIQSTFEVEIEVKD